MDQQSRKGCLSLESLPKISALLVPFPGLEHLDFGD